MNKALILLCTCLSVPLFSQVNGSKTTQTVQGQILSTSPAAPQQQWVDTPVEIDALTEMRAQLEKVEKSCYQQMDYDGKSTRKEQEIIYNLKKAMENLK